MTTELHVVFASICGKLFPVGRTLGAKLTVVVGALAGEAEAVVIVVVTTGLLPKAIDSVLASDGFIPIGDIGT